MAQLTQQVVAAERFLLGLRSLPKYEELRSKQIERLLNLIPKQAVSLSEAGSLVSSLRADIWGDQHVATLKEALASAVEDSAEPVQKTRVQLQDYATLVHYLDQTWWHFLLDGRGCSNKHLALEQLCKLCCALGCKNPTEKTFAAILVLVYGLDPDKILSEPEKFQVLQAHKPAMKKIFAAAAVDCGLLLEKLPETVSECPPQILAFAYPKGFVPYAPAQVDFVHLLAQVETFPLRKTNRAAPATPASSSHGVGTGVPDGFWQGLFSYVAASRSSGSLDDSQSSDVPGFRMLQNSKRAKTSVQPQAVLPLEDKKASIEEKPGTSTQACDTAANSSQLTQPAEQKAEALIASMQAGLEAEKEATCEKNKRLAGKKTKAPAKKPSSKSAEASFKRPAAKAASAKTALSRDAKGSGHKELTASKVPCKRTATHQMAKARELLFKKFHRNCRTSTGQGAQHVGDALSVLSAVGRKEGISKSNAACEALRSFAAVEKGHETVESSRSKRLQTKRGLPHEK